MFFKWLLIQIYWPLQFRTSYNSCVDFVFTSTTEKWLCVVELLRSCWHCFRNVQNTKTPQTSLAPACVIFPNQIVIIHNCRHKSYQNLYIFQFKNVLLFKTVRFLYPKRSFIFSVDLTNKKPGEWVFGQFAWRLNSNFLFKVSSCNFADSFELG